MVHFCPECNRKFTRKFNRDRHFKRVHEQGFTPEEEEGSSALVCPFCRQRDGALVYFTDRRDLVAHVDETHPEELSSYKLRKSALGGKVEIFTKVLVSLQPLDQFVNDRQNQREIEHVILSALSKFDIVRVALVVTAHYQISHPEEEEEKSGEGGVGGGQNLAEQRDSFALRSHSSFFIAHDNDHRRTFRNRVKSLLRSLLAREEDLLTRGSGWQFESLSACDIEIVRTGLIG